VRAIHVRLSPQVVNSKESAAEVFNVLAPLLGASRGFADESNIVALQVPGADDASTEVFYRIQPPSTACPLRRCHLLGCRRARFGHGHFRITRRSLTT
jgi:hypothetical protein